METMVRESWTDEIGKRIDERFDDIDKRLEKIDGRLESMQKTLVFGVIAMSSAYLAGFAALVTQI